MARIVMKFGGTSVADVARIRNAAERVRGSTPCPRVGMTEQRELLLHGRFRGEASQGAGRVDTHDLVRVAECCERGLLGSLRVRKVCECLPGRTAQ